MPQVCQAEVRRISPFIAGSGESPVWSAGEGRLYWVDQEAHTLNRFDPETGGNEAWRMPALCSSFGLRGAGRKVLVALRTGLFDFDPAMGVLDSLAAAPYAVEDQRFNDGRCDRQGRFWIGAVDLRFSQTRELGQARVYRYDERGLAAPIEDITCTNGLAFSPDGRTMYLADTTIARVYAFDYDMATGTPSNRRVFMKLGRGEGLPDGAEVDSEGGYWIALLQANAIARYRPDGSLDFRIDVPVLQPTKIAFGGPDLSTLYLTSASHRHMPGDQPLGADAGAIFAIGGTGYRGIPEPMFAG